MVSGAQAAVQENVFEPLAELVTQLAPAMHEIDPMLIAEPKTGKSISRVFRDTRFTKDPSLFREEMWCVFTRDKKAYTSAPGYFLSFLPTGSVTGAATSTRRRR